MKMMSKYSCYEHSHSLETPIFLTDIKSIEVDVIAIRDWSSEYKKDVKKHKRFILNELINIMLVLSGKSKSLI